MYHTFFGLKPEGSFKTFHEAAKSFFPRIMKLASTQSANAFTTTNCIGCFTKRGGQPLFYQMDPIEVSNFCVENGFAKDGKIVDNPPSLSDKNVETLFVAASLKRKVRLMEAILLGAHFERTGKIDL
jgi:hypothetical protein